MTFPEYPSYENLVGTFATILLKVDDNDYQGDSRLLLTDGFRFGLLFFGWGSCSGCDALQSAQDDGERALRELRDDLANKTHWEDNAAALAAYIEGKDWSLDLGGGSVADAAFRARTLEILRDLAAGRTDAATVETAATKQIGR